MPKLGLTMASGTIVRWLRAPGDAIVQGEPLLEVATDKINYEVEAPASGTLGALIAQEGDELACGATVTSILALGETLPPSPATTSPASIPVPYEAPANRFSASASNGTRTIASPAARRLARERGVLLGDVRGTGPRGRITLSDIHDHRGNALAAAASAPAAFPPQLDPRRRAIYRKMNDVALLPLAHVETTARVDALAALIARRGDIGWTAYAVFACARLLRLHVDLRIDARSGAPHPQIDIGVAADTPHGLIVPVVRGADALSLAETHAEIVRLAQAARAGTLVASALGNAAFSISNVGPQGIERVAPLVDAPQTAILGIGAATVRAAVVDGALVPARVLTCVLAFDHRFIDGAPAARFLAALADALVDPGMLL